MAWSELVGQRATAKNDTEGASFNIAFPGDVTAGDLICVGGAFWDTEGALTAFAVTKASGSATLTAEGFVEILGHGVSSTGGATFAFLAFAQVQTSGSLTVTVTPDGTAFISMGTAEFTGGDPSPLDVNGGAAFSESADTTYTDTITIGTADALIVGVVALGTSNGVPVSPGSAYTQIGEDETFTSSIWNMEYRLATTVTTYTVDWTTTNTGSNYDIVNASFKVASGPTLASASESAGVGAVDAAAQVRVMIRAAETR